MAVYDPVGDRLVIHGGTDDWYPSADDLWTMPLAGNPQWSRLAPSGTAPPLRDSHSAIYDAPRQRIIIFGGKGPAALNNVWELSVGGPPAWSQISPSGTPPHGRYGHSAIFDPVRNRMIIFGGTYYGPSFNLLNDVWALSLAGPPAWTPLAPLGTAPAARYWHAAIYDPVRDRMLVFGGNGGSRLNDVWELSLSGTPTWTQLSPGGTPPSARDGASAIYDPVRDRMVLFGGYSTTYLRDTWALGLTGNPTWASLQLGAVLPPFRTNSSLIYDPIRDRALMFGGLSATSLAVSDLWTLWPPGVLDVPADRGPRGFALAPIAPNPSRSAVRIAFTVPRPTRVSLRVYDLAGRIVATLLDGPVCAGAGVASWDRRSGSGPSAAPGVYLCELRAGAIRLARRIVLLR